MMARSRFWTFFIWAAVLSGSGLINLIWGPMDEFIARLSPISIWQLPHVAWPAIAATVVASVMAWLSAVIGGSTLGAVCAAGHLASARPGRFWQIWASTAAGIRRAFNALYVVPLVLTISVVTTILLKGQLDGHLSPPAVGALLVATSGLTLAGQRIFVAVDDAVASAGVNDILFAKNLYFGAPRGPKWLQPIVRLFQETRFLVHRQIALLAQALEQAFHLAVVGIVIVETVSGLRLYENFFPQEARLLSWGGGIGRVIIDGQNSTNPALVAGAVWLILIIDGCIALFIRYWAFRFWVRPHRRSE